MSIKPTFDISTYVGKRFGRLIILGFDHDDRGPNNSLHHFVKCHCDCGNDVITDIQYLKTGRKRSCGCYRREITIARSTTFNPKDYIGKRYGRLIVIDIDHDDFSGKAKTIRHFMRCICDCGNEIIVDIHSLKRGTTSSCGCFRKDFLKDVATTHGLSKTRLYHIWIGMKARCHNKNHAQYLDYGGRGIEVCDIWKNNFIEFYTWAISHGYDDNLSIDRIDNNDGYNPINCRWVSGDVQGKNKRNNVYLTYTIKTLLTKKEQKRLNTEEQDQYLTFCLRDWSRIFNMPSQTLSKRVKYIEDMPINEFLEECNFRSKGTKDITIPDEIMIYNDPSKYNQSYHD